MAGIGKPRVVALRAYAEASSSRAPHKVRALAERACNRLPRDAEGRAGAARCPKRSVVSPAGELPGDFPACDAGEQVDAGEASKVAGLDFADVTVVDLPQRNQTAGHQLVQAVDRERVVVVVVRHDLSDPSTQADRVLM